jgi:hypothetical protein
VTPRQVKLFAIVLAAIGIGLGLTALWTPDRQIELHSRHLLGAVEHRRFRKIGGFIDAAYTDAWGYKKATLQRDLEQVLRQFFALQIRVEALQCSIAGDSATSSFRLKIEGTGTAIADAAQREINELDAPFVLTWRHGSWRPWDWTLVRMENSHLRVAPHETFDSIF